MAMRAEAAAVAELWDELLALSRRLNHEDWARTTPCERWSVKDVFAHMAGLQTAFDGSAPQPELPEGWQAPDGLSGLDAITEAGVVARRDWNVAQVLEEVAAAKAGHVARLESADPDDEAMGPFGPTTMSGLHGTRIFDLWSHLQDVRIAVGEKPDTEAATASGQQAAQYVFGGLPRLAVKKAGMEEGQRLSVRVHHPVPVDGVLEVSGGRATWAQDDSPEPADRIEAAPGALLLLLGGRRSPEQWREDGVLSWSGELGEAFARRARLFG